MPKIWLLRLSYNPPSKDMSLEHKIFEKDKHAHDIFFENKGYGIIRVDIAQPNSYKLPNKNIYLVGRDFFEFYDNEISSSSSSESNELREIFDQIVMSLSCIKDIVQEIGGQIYINPNAFRLKRLFNLMGHEVTLQQHHHEGGSFLKGTPPKGVPFLIVSHDMKTQFSGLNITILQSPPNIGADAEDYHIDTYFGIINFKEQTQIEGEFYNGILYIHTATLKKVKSDQKKTEIWEILRDEMIRRKYLIREYIPGTDSQKIGINFKIDPKNNALLTNAFPQKERKFLATLGLTVTAPESDFGANDYRFGGINCSYFLLPHSENIQKNIINWITEEV